jgi:SAM-dependent methyltransferase
LSLSAVGFTDLNGVDPFIESGSTHDGVTITKGVLGDLTGTFGFVLLIHSLEHAPDPRASLHQLARLTETGGHILISIPVINQSWSELGSDWIELDPPRHLFIPSVSGLIDLIASVPGFRLKDTVFDTSALEFYGSRLARMRVPLRDRATAANTDPHRFFDRTQLGAWSKRAREYNKLGKAGRASFLIQRV